jgi:hypothetical protein|tara:strand:- start:2183 stop:2404 length:222 start_codon:yes stop_codon:yes gene_type:complete
MDNKKLAQAANTETWKIIKKLLNDTAEKYYGWGIPKQRLPEAKGVQEFKSQIIRTVEGAADALPTGTTADRST